LKGAYDLYLKTKNRRKSGEGLSDMSKRREGISSGEKKKTAVPGSSRKKEETILPLPRKTLSYRSSPHEN